jgi:hypothetical protein
MMRLVYLWCGCGASCYVWVLARRRNKNCDRRKTDQQVGNVRWKRRNGGDVAEEDEGEEEGREVEGGEAGGLV